VDKRDRRIVAVNARETPFAETIRIRSQSKNSGFRQLTEKEWARYRAENRLDLYGRRITSTAERVAKDSICAHATPEE